MVNATINAPTDAPKESKWSRKTAQKKKAKETTDVIEREIDIGTATLKFIGDNSDRDDLKQAADYISQVPDLEGLMNVLQVIGQVHPIINVVVTALNGVLLVFQKYKENHQRVQLLIVTMHKMLRCFLVLRPLVKDTQGPSPKESRDINAQDLLKRTIEEIVKTIDDCRETCFAYQSEEHLFRLVKGWAWESKLEKIADRFTELAEELQSHLTMYTATSIMAFGQSLSEIQQQMRNYTSGMENIRAMVSAMFQAHTEDEFIAYKLLRDAGSANPSDGRDILEQGAVLVSNSEEKFSQLPEKLRKKMTAHSFLLGCQRDIKASLADASKKLDVLQGLVEGSEETSRRRHIQLMKAIDAGPHDRIIDEDVQTVWHDMGWKGSVKSKSLVLALRDHFIEKGRVDTGTSDSQGTIASKSAEGIDDSWAMKYLNILRAQPLLEALDADSSSYVTISEINAFTYARPDGWSLRLWLAYWAYGSAMTTEWYFKRLHVVLYQLWQTARRVHPLNRRLASDILQSFSIHFVDKLLSGYTDSNVNGSYHTWSSDERFGIFKKYVLNTELKIADNLRQLDYRIDGQHILTLILGKEVSLEKSLLPAIFVLLKRVLWIMEKSQTVPVDPREFSVCEGTLWVIYAAVSERIDALKATWGVHHLDEQSQLKRFFFGLYANIGGASNTGSTPNRPTTDPYDLPSPWWSASLELPEADMHIGGDMNESSKETLQNPGYPQSLASSLSAEERVRCQTVVTSTVYCDACSAEDCALYLRCVDCSMTLGGVDSVDLCADCYRARKTPVREAYNHQSHHVVVQLRMPILLTHSLFHLAEARYEVEIVSDRYRNLPQQESEEFEADPEQASFPKCNGCSCQIKTTPFWDCMDCHDQYTFYCEDCGLKLSNNPAAQLQGEESVPSPTAAAGDTNIVTSTLTESADMEAKPSSDAATEDKSDDGQSSGSAHSAGTDDLDGHQSWHTLVSISPKQVEGTVEKPQPSVEERINALTDMFQEQRNQFTKLAYILRRFAPSDVIATLEQEMPELHLLKRGSPTEPTEAPVVSALATADALSEPVLDHKPSAATPEVVQTGDAVEVSAMSNFHNDPSVEEGSV